MLNKDGSRALARVLTTCMLLRGEKLDELQEGVVCFGSEISMGKFRKNFPGIMEKTAKKIKFFCKERIIGMEDIYSFFAGNIHVSDAISNISKLGFGGAIAERLLLFHMLLPIVITKEELDGGTEGLYAEAVFLRNIANPLKVKVSVGESVLVHYGYIVDKIDNEFGDRMLLGQKKCNELLDAYKEKRVEIDCAAIRRAFSLMKREVS